MRRPRRFLSPKLPRLVCQLCSFHALYGGSQTLDFNPVIVTFSLHGLAFHHAVYRLMMYGRTSSEM